MLDGAGGGAGVGVGIVGGSVDDDMVGSVSFHTAVNIIVGNGNGIAVDIFGDGSPVQEYIGVVNLDGQIINRPWIAGRSELCHEDNRS